MTQSGLTHFNDDGAAHMVAITEKHESSRSATAFARVQMANATLEAIRSGTIGKGDVLGVARLAGITGAKQTPQLIPLCHPVRLTHVDIRFEIHAATTSVTIFAQVDAFDRTGPEMEAMSAASTAALTIYDMCKASERGIEIAEIKLLEKSGGK